MGRDTIIYKAYTALDQFNWTDEELATYEKLRRIDRDNKAAMAQEIHDANAEEKMQIAKRLLQAGCGTDLVAQATNLSKEQTEGLKKDILEEPSAVNF